MEGWNNLSELTGATRLLHSLLTPKSQLQIACVCVIRRFHRFRVSWQTSLHCMGRDLATNKLLCDIDDHVRLQASEGRCANHPLQRLAPRHTAIGQYNSCGHKWREEDWLSPSSKASSSHVWPYPAAAVRIWPVELLTVTRLLNRWLAQMGSCHIRSLGPNRPWFTVNYSVDTFPVDKFEAAVSRNWWCHWHKRLDEN